jgi:fructose-1,6-bisphosphatase
MNFSQYIRQKVNNRLVKILEAIQDSSIKIESLIEQAALQNLHGAHNNINSSGDQQKKLDVISNEIMIENLKNTNECSILLSEENEDAIVLATAYIIHLAKLTNSSSTFVSWSTEDIRFTNTTAANTMRNVLETLQTELNTLFATRIAQPVMSRQPLNIVTGTKVY